jgi:YegS/Rv2252/BmrU family lipid kinase
LGGPELKPFVVYNPAAGGGRTGREWPHIAALLTGRLGPVDHAASRRAGEIPALVRAALSEGPRLIVAVGGDGTMSDAIDGMFDAGRPVAEGASFGFVSTGTGGDFRRSFGWAGGVEGDVARLATGMTRTIDLGLLGFTNERRETAIRHFHNIASFGVSGSTARAASEATHARLLGAKGLFLFKTVTTLLAYRFQTVRLQVDNHFDETIPIALVAIANGAWFGGGMNVAPQADPSDGLFDVVIVRGDTKLQLIRSLNRLYDGSHTTHPAVRILRGQRVRAAAVDEAASEPVLIETDGEVPGRLPASFELLPGALTLRG